MRSLISERLFDSYIDILPVISKMDSVPDRMFEEEVCVKKQAPTEASWNQLFLKDELRRALRQNGLEAPSPVQVQAIPYALQGNDLLCQSKSGSGKTIVFVLSLLNSLLLGKDREFLPFQGIVLAHTRQLAHQIHREFKRMGKYFRRPELRFACVFGGISVEDNIRELTRTDKLPHIVIGTPGRMLDLNQKKVLHLDLCKFFVVDQCDKIVESPSFSNILRQIFNQTPANKQTIMLSATLSEQRMKECARYMVNPTKVAIDEGKLVLTGLTQYYVRLPEDRKFDKLVLLLDALAFNQVIIFTNRVDRAKKLVELLKLKLFNPICIHSALKQEERIRIYDLFKANGSRLLIATDLFGRGVDIERVNLVINYDFPEDGETYLHRVGRAGRFYTRGLAINFLRSEGQDDQMIIEIQNRYNIKIQELPTSIDPSKYA